MRVNVYGEEITDRITLVEKRVNEGGEIYTFYGIRFWLKFPNQEWWLHRKVGGHIDDDSSAVTIWAQDKDKLELLFRRALGVLGGHGGEYGMAQIDQDMIDEGMERRGTPQDFEVPRRKPDINIQEKPFA